jgi:hypothetical protein
VKNLITACLLAIALLAAAAAEAQTSGTRVTPCDPATPNNALCVEWGASTTYTNGQAIPAGTTVTYRVERLTLTTLPTWILIESTAQVRSYVRNLAPGTYTFRVVAIVNSIESLPTPSATGTATALPPPVPNPPPTIQVVQVIIGVDHVPVFTVLSDGSRSNTVGGMVPVGTECEGPVLFRYRNKEWRKPVTFKPWNTPATARVAAPCA